MRMSCNGCRVLRKGCSENCSIKPCLQWIQTSESQANATLFLAKFYGRAGLINLINTGPEHLRPAIFRSLLYEACGRIVNPIYGSVGLLWTGSWQQCQDAVEAVLKGKPIEQISSTDQLALDACDIRHVSKYESSAASDRLHKVRSKISQFKRSAPKPKPKLEAGFDFMTGTRSVSPESALSWQTSLGADNGEGDSVSIDTVEASMGKLDEPADGSILDLELSLGFR